MRLLIRGFDSAIGLTKVSDIFLEFIQARRHPFRDNMASKLAMNPFVRLATASKATTTCQFATRRFAYSLHTPTTKILSHALTKILTRPPTKPSCPPLPLRQTFRRSYADVAPPKPKRRIRGFFKWTWRLLYVSAIAGAGYLAYTIYLLRTPSDQYAPDPAKKTLVILGTYRP